MSAADRYDFTTSRAKKLLRALFFATIVAGTSACSTGSTVLTPSTSTTTTEFLVSGRDIELVDGPTTVTAAASTLRRSLTLPSGAQLMFVKGIDYGPTPIGEYSIGNPLGNERSALWSRDLPAMRSLGVNALKVYNVDLNVGPIDRFLNAAYNGGDRPIFVVLSIFFPGAAALNSGAVASLTQQYQRLAQTYGNYPSVLGISIGSEINASDLIANPAWWRNLNTIIGGIRAGYAKAGAQKIVTTSMVDDAGATVRAGEANNFKIDAWGINSYRGHTFTDLWTQTAQATKKPLLIGEYGAPASYHTGAQFTYDVSRFVCTGGLGSANVNDAAVLPPAGPVNMPDLVNYVGGLASELYANSTAKGGIGSGGFYFEWNDEWWKANSPGIHLGGPLSGSTLAANAVFPGCINDEAWYGLNAIAPGNPNVFTQRPTAPALRSVWSTQSAPT